ncbi:MAG: Do family serine endopeptidase [Cyclobacteriaceae bacterium]
MSNKNLFLSMMLSSIVGGVVAIGGYQLLAPPIQPVIQTIPASQESSAAFTNYNFDTTGAIVPEGLNFVFAAKSSTEGVVHIRTTIDASAHGSTAFEEMFRDYFGETPRGGGGRARTGAGSGVIVHGDGYIVTNNHVIDHASDIEVLLSDNRTYKAEIIGVDPTTDLAVLKIEGDGFPTVNWGNSDELNIGEWVLAVGNPYSFRSTVTAGIVSAKARNINILRENNARTNLQIESFIQTDAAVNPGNSGGALVNLNGELVGINTAIMSPTGAFAGYSFAVPVSLVKKVFEDLVEYGTVQRALLGINIVDVNSDLADQEELDVIQGVYISNVRDNSAAEEAGLEVGDVIVAIDGRAITNVSELQERVALNRPGDEVKVTFRRDGNANDVMATLKNTAGTLAVVERKATVTAGGAEFANASDRLLESLELDGGVEVVGVGDGKWEDIGVKTGFIITRIDKRPIKNVEDLEDALERSKGEGILLEGYYPNGEKAYYGIGW